MTTYVKLSGRKRKREEKNQNIDGAAQKKVFFMRQESMEDLLQYAQLNNNPNILFQQFQMIRIRQERINTTLNKIEQQNSRSRHSLFKPNTIYICSEPIEDLAPPITKSNNKKLLTWNK